MRLTRHLPALETWGFGLSGLLLWLGTAPGMHLELGHSALWVWIPCAIVGILLNLQVKHLGHTWQDMAGGTPNYATRLLNHQPQLARYVAIGYYMGWISVPPMNAIILSDLIAVHLEPLGITAPTLALKIGFTAIPYIVAFSGTRALGILHLFFVVPAIGFLMTFCLQGLGWLAWAPASPGFWGMATPEPTHFGLQEWAKWYFVAVYAAYGCETASSFVADSRKPKTTLHSLTLAAVCLPVVYIGGSWIISRLATGSHIQDNAFLALETAAQPFWGAAAPVLVTFLIASGCLLSSATAVSNSPRVLYQLAIDGYMAPIFSIVSRRGVFGPGLLFTALLSLVCLIWGDVTRVVMVTGTGYLISMIGIHWGLWVQRRHPATRWAGLALVCCGVELAVLVVGGLAWNWQDWLMGLMLPIAIVLLNTLIANGRGRWFQVQWWEQKEQRRSPHVFTDLMLTQVTVLIVLVCGATTIGWATRGALSQLAIAGHANIFVVLLLLLAFVGVAIACWTSFPQVASIIEAREAAEHLFNTAQDAIIVVNQQGQIQQVNPAAQALFGNHPPLLKTALNQLLPNLPADPSQWPHSCEQQYTRGDRVNILELSISDRTNTDWHEYVVILRDVTERKQAETQLRMQTLELNQAFQELQSTQAKLVQSEKMSSLGQLVAGVAHEINNPVNFIAGNLIHAHTYSQDLLTLIAAYQQAMPHPNDQIRNLEADIELDFLAEDLPKLLNSMQMGVDRIQKIVASLRTFSRMDEADMKAVDIHTGLESSLLILQNRLKAKGNKPEIQITREYADLPLIECYAGALNQVFMNILSNAVDALDDEINTHLAATPATTPPFRPMITLRTQRIEGDRVQIRIGNNGSPIPEAIQQRLFDPFFTTKPIGKGTGLGLSISYGIITEKHGGQIRCHSCPEQGTEFILEIPIQQQAIAMVSCH